MTKEKTTPKKNIYSSLIKDISSLLESARKSSAKAVNTILTATYWEIGRRIVEFEYQGMSRKEYYGEKLVVNISKELTKKYGRGFSRQNIQSMKKFYEEYDVEKICQTLSSNSSEEVDFRKEPANLLKELPSIFPLSWSHYVKLLTQIFHWKICPSGRQFVS
ncbi:MAG: DUF1016 N-terminal domain-containing protein [Melioribacteraceae bacterium]|nr:DUF1016 N-terminal domain-containing protein [Melioribacteraceae bacterium]MCF8356773.1 DUF1016 N-terminal domain-containing protein [Melioribacteraceae bacterium]MCF8396135.1 DUF1016 N-terminal domain-containing protein [Melioribacteraceae bacterium]MCF8421099.1 DUF1016 N-terminal domain-containing protein [Melioribacteraceae bacterium]